MTVERKINWKLPENVVGQHRLRYQDQLLHASFADTTKVFVGTGVGINGALTPKELVKLQKAGIDSRRRNYLETGGDKKAADENILFGANMHTTDPDEISGVVIFKKKL